jgi:hypothetical protein
VAPSGIESATYGHVPQYLNQLLARQRAIKWEINVCRKDCSKPVRNPRIIYLFIYLFTVKNKLPNIQKCRLLVGMNWKDVKETRLWTISSISW